jgi:hypothetical protein
VAIKDCVFLFGLPPWEQGDLIWLKLLGSARGGAADQYRRKIVCQQPQPANPPAGSDADEFFDPTGASGRLRRNRMFLPFLRASKPIS